MTGDPEREAARPPSRRPLGVAAVAFTVIALAGPLMLAAGGDPRPYAWLIAPLWAVVLGGLGLWLRDWFRALRRARGRG